jgi:hypothetical protein
MTDIESLQEAKRRWGECAYVRLDKRDEHVYKVGVREGELFWVMGAGKSWTGNRHPKRTHPPRLKSASKTDPP